MAEAGGERAEFDIPPAKRARVEGETSHRKGIAPVKAEYLITNNNDNKMELTHQPDDDAAEAKHRENVPPQVGDRDQKQRSRGWGQRGKGKENNKQSRGGQNKNRDFGKWGDKVALCNSRAYSDEFSPLECSFGDKCKLAHDLRKYMAEGRLRDLETFDGKCPVFEERGFCPVGWKCRFIKSHSKEVDHEDGRKELVLIDNRDQEAKDKSRNDSQEEQGFYNTLSGDARFQLQRRHFETEKSDKYLQWITEMTGYDQRKENDSAARTKKESADGPPQEKAETEDGAEQGKVEYAKPATEDVETKNGGVEAQEQPSTTTKEDQPADIEKPSTEENQDGVDRSKTADAMDVDKNGHETKEEHTTAAAEVKPDNEGKQEEKLDNRARYTEPPFRPSEKRRLYYGADTPVLAPLTTQGNLPFRRLCVDLGAQLTFSEMAVGLPLLQGAKGEWALMRAHESEIAPPTLSPESVVPDGYDSSKDLKFGVQIAANKPWIALKTTEVLTNFCPKVRAIDLNCGCPIDLIFKTGAGSALLDAPAKLEKILRGMNTLSGEIPITAKIRMGTRDNKPNADAVVNRLLLGGHDARDLGLGPSGVAAITLHGRSRQQRYTRSADWEYIADIAALIKRINKDKANAEDTVRELDARDQPNGGKVYFLGNGDCFSPEDYYGQLKAAQVDSIMIGRGALVKPWLFEEIASQQLIDKSATERLAYVEKFVRYGLDTWGSDETGVNTTRRFLLEWLSFTYRYVPIALLETLPPKMNERPPKYKGRNELETLLASDNYLDWIKISEMFLGRPNAGFKFIPKHKSNAYELEAEG